MALMDAVITRLQAAGVTVTDLRGVLPRNGTWLTRPVGAIQIISEHYDAENRPHEYDSVARYVAQAWYHINKDWGGGAHGDGLMYDLKIDNVGEVFICRDFEDVLWAVGDANYRALSICYDGGAGQAPTREQMHSGNIVTEVLSYQVPEFPATQGNVLGHQEVPGNSTSCPGEFLPAIKAYRNERNMHEEKYTYDYSPAPAPTPTPPAPTVDDRPQWLKDAVFERVTLFAQKDTTLVDLTNGSVVLTYLKGTSFDTTAKSGDYRVTQYSFTHVPPIGRGIPDADLATTPPVDPTPAPAPDPVPPVPPIQPDPTPPDENNALLKQILALVQWIKDKISSVWK